MVPVFEEWALPRAGTHQQGRVGGVVLVAGVEVLWVGGGGQDGEFG